MRPAFPPRTAERDKKQDAVCHYGGLLLQKAGEILPLFACRGHIVCALRSDDPRLSPYYVLKGLERVGFSSRLGVGGILYAAVGDPRTAVSRRGRNKNSLFHYMMSPFCPAPQYLDAFYNYNLTYVWLLYILLSTKCGRAPRRGCARGFDYIHGEVIR